MATTPREPSCPISMPSIPLPPNSLEMSPPSRAMTVSRSTVDRAVFHSHRSMEPAKSYRSSHPDTRSWQPFCEVRPSRSFSARLRTSGRPLSVIAPSSTEAALANTFPQSGKTAASNFSDVLLRMDGAMFSFTGRLLSCD